MKLASTTSSSFNPDTTAAVIPLLRSKAKVLEKGQYHTYKLCTTPTLADSTVYDLSVPFFDNGIPEEWIKFQSSVTAVLKGQNVTQGPSCFGVVKTLLKDDALTVFKTAEGSHGNQTLVNFQLCLDDVCAHVFPEKAGQLQIRLLPRLPRK